jgi:hypothetical protein
MRSHGINPAMISNKMEVIRPEGRNFDGGKKRHSILRQRPIEGFTL